MRKIQYKDTFLGNIELTLVYEDSKTLLGEDIIREIYKDKFENFYINTHLISQPNNFTVITRELFELLKINDNKI